MHGPNNIPSAYQINHLPINPYPIPKIDVNGIAFNINGVV